MSLGPIDNNNPIYTPGNEPWKSKLASGFTEWSNKHLQNLLPTGASQGESDLAKLGVVPMVSHTTTCARTN